MDCIQFRARSRLALVCTRSTRPLPVPDLQPPKRAVPDAETALWGVLGLAGRLVPTPEPEGATPARCASFSGGARWPLRVCTHSTEALVIKASTATRLAGARPCSRVASTLTDVLPRSSGASLALVHALLSRARQLFLLGKTIAYSVVWLSPWRRLSLLGIESSFSVSITKKTHQARRRGGCGELERRDSLIRQSR
jgi:hypothetical protein